MWLQAFCSLLILQWPLHSWKPFPQKITLKKTLSLSHCACRNDTRSTLQFCFLTLEWWLLLSFIKGGFFFPPGCKEKITVFVFLVTRVMCSHPNLLCKSFQSSFLTLGTAFDLFLRSFLCYTTFCLTAKCAYCCSIFSPKSLCVLLLPLHLLPFLFYALMGGIQCISMCHCSRPWTCSAPCVPAFPLQVLGVSKAEGLPKLVFSWSPFPLHLGFRCICWVFIYPFTF